MNSSRFSMWTFIVLLLCSLVLVIHLLFGFITPVVLALVIVSIFKPLYVWLLKIFKQRDYLAAGVATLVISLGVLVPIVAFGIVFAHQGVMLFQKTEQLTSPDITTWMTSLKSYLQILQSTLAKYNINISTQRILSFTSTLAEGLSSWFYNSIGIIASNVFALIINSILMVALVFVFFVSGGVAKNFVMDLVPLPHDEKERVIKRFRELSFAVFVGNGTISLFEGLLGGISFFVFGISGALIWGVAMAVTSFLPMIGAFIIVIPATIYLFLVGNTWAAILFFAFNTTHLMILEAVVKPRLIGTKSQMHAVLVFLSVFAGVQIYGTFGLFYGPLAVTLFLTLAGIYKEHYRERLL